MPKRITLLALLLASCANATSTGSSVVDEPSLNSPIETKETESSVAKNDSSNHERIYLYEQGNVPYDGGNGEKYAFLTPFLAENPTGGAVIVVPGGGYTHLSNSTPKENGKFGGSDNEGDQKEASAIAPYYNEAGISVFVLNYRTTIVDPSLDYRGFLSDCLRAIRVVSSNSERFHFEKLCLQGYSAGGHLALSGVEHPDFALDDPNYKEDEIDSLPISVDSLVLGYPVVSLLNGQTHASSRQTFTKGDASLYEEYSAQLHVEEGFPATYLFHEVKDPSVPIVGSEKLAEAMEFLDIPYRFDRFKDEASEEVSLHGFGVTRLLPEASAWMENATSFLKERGF